MNKSLFSELKRRNVFKVAAAYIIVSWLTLQVVGSITPMLDLPDVFGKMVLVLLLIGLPIALIFAWAFEMTPEGLKKESEVNREDSITHTTSRKIDFIIIGALVLIIGGFVYDKFGTEFAPTEPEINPTQSSKLAAEKSQLTISAPAEKPLTLGVAVLPFENLSEDPNNAFFAGGVYEDVLTYLSRIVQLRVISRTSMVKIAKRGMEIRDIGKYLDVSHVLEGSVRRAGNRVRVTVQLINAKNDEHIWAENYDRNLDDIFAIQTEIAKKIAKQLKTELSPDQQQLLSTRPTNSIEAYDLFIKARVISQVWRGSKTFSEQIPLLEKALQLDPHFVQAKVRLLMSYGRMVWTGADPDGEYHRKADALKDQILTEYPKSDSAYAAQAYYAYTILRNYQAAVSFIKQGLTLNPNDSALLLTLASSYKRLGQFEQGIEISKKLYSLDPEHASNANELTTLLIFANRIGEAFAQAKSNFKNFPLNINTINTLASMHWIYFGDAKNFLLLLKPLANKSPTDVDWAYYRFIVNTENIEAIIASLATGKTIKPSPEKAFIEIQIAELLNIIGLEQRSQQMAEKVINYFQSNKNIRQSVFRRSPNIENAFFSYWACLANNKTLFRRYDKAYKSSQASEILNQQQAIEIHALALEECGQLNEAWKMLNAQKGKPFTSITDWALVLDPLYQHYFSKLPEYQALQKRLQGHQTNESAGQTE